MLQVTEALGQAIEREQRILQSLCTKHGPLRQRGLSLLSRLLHSSVPFGWLFSALAVLLAWLVPLIALLSGAERRNTRLDRSLPFLPRRGDMFSPLTQAPVQSRRVHLK